MKKVLDYSYLDKRLLVIFQISQYVSPLRETGEGIHSGEERLPSK